MTIEDHRIEIWFTSFIDIVQSTITFIFEDDEKEENFSSKPVVVVVIESSLTSSTKFFVDAHYRFNDRKAVMWKCLSV